GRVPRRGARRRRPAARRGDDPRDARRRAGGQGPGPDPVGEEAFAQEPVPKAEAVGPPQRAGFLLQGRPPARRRRGVQGVPRLRR
ncbi:MAG: hypothetical protein AVDCRST_MAG01-01-5027, partial [uncultured Rubrobacteraceae bacterium]